MSITLEELVGSYVSRTERRNSAYFQQIVRRLLKYLRSLGYEDGANSDELRMTIRRALAQEQELTRDACVTKAKLFASSKHEAEDLAQDSWLEALEKAELDRPEPSKHTWKQRLTQMRSPATVPASMARKGRFRAPAAVEFDSVADLECQEPYVPMEEEHLDVRLAFESLGESLQQDLLDLIIYGEPITAFAQRKQISLPQAEQRLSVALTAMREAVDGP